MKRSRAGDAEPDGDVAERYLYYMAYGYCYALTPAFGVRYLRQYDWQYLYTGRDVDPQTWLYNYRTRPYHPYLVVYRILSCG